jgi:hypothetical protein
MSTEIELICWTVWRKTSVFVSRDATLGRLQRDVSEGVVPSGSHACCKTTDQTTLALLMAQKWVKVPLETR